MGSAALFFRLKPKAALLSDINSELVDTFIAVRDHPRAVYNRYKKLPQGKDNYYKIRSMNSSTMTYLDRAARFIYLNRFCFNGIFRTNQKGQFNVPYAPKGTGELLNWDSLHLIAKTLQHGEIICADFEAIIKKHIRRGDFVYLDPPYAVDNRRIFRQYGPQTFGLEDIDRLRESLQLLDRIGADFVVSYALSKEGLNAFSEWNVRRVVTQRNVSGFAKHRRKAIEILASNIEH